MTDQKTSKTNPPLYGTISNNVSSSREPGRLLLTGIWMVALSLVLLAAYIGWRVQPTQASPPITTPLPTSQTDLLASSSKLGSAELPLYIKVNPEDGIIRRTALHTNIPTRPRTEVIEYSVSTGDSVFGMV